MECDQQPTKHRWTVYRVEVLKPLNVLLHALYVRDLTNSAQLNLEASGWHHTFRTSLSLHPPIGPGGTVVASIGGLVAHLGLVLRTGESGETTRLDGWTVSTQRQDCRLPNLVTWSSLVSFLCLSRGANPFQLGAEVWAPGR